MADYEKQFRNDPAACGAPFPEFRAFFNALNAEGLRVLDLGCGQGRDALMVAELGHHVHGVDNAPTGVAQMLEAAQSMNLSVTGEVADIREFVPGKSYDVVLLDRVLHQLPTDMDRNSVLLTASRCVRQTGHLLIADTPKHVPMIREFFEHIESAWAVVKRQKSFLFVQKNAESAG